MFIMALFTTAKNWKPFIWLSVRLQINKSWYLHVLGYYSAKKMNCRRLQKDGSYRFDVERKSQYKKVHLCDPTYEVLNQSKLAYGD